jgi:hypothetical protein
MTRRKGELTASRIDRDWPHQVALPADRVVGENYSITHDFCRSLSLCPRGHSVVRGSVTYVIFCFAEPTDADHFRERFNGERFDPKEKGRRNNWFLFGGSELELADEKTVFA